MSGKSSCRPFSELHGRQRKLPATGVRQVVLIDILPAGVTAPAVNVAKVTPRPEMEGSSAPTAAPAASPPPASRFPALRFHPALAYQNESSRRRFPALVAAVPALPAAAALSAGSLAAFIPPPGAARLLIAADRDATGRRAAATLEARALAQGIAATVLSPKGGDFNDDLAALGPQALAARLGHGTM